MATLIPALGPCKSRMTSGENSLAERREKKLEDDYLLSWSALIAPKQPVPFRRAASGHKLDLPWSYGVGFITITRKQFEGVGLGQAIKSHFFIGKDEMYEGMAPNLSSSTCGPCTHTVLAAGGLTLLRFALMRWILFPEVHGPQQQSLFGTDAGGEAELPDILRICEDGICLRNDPL